MQKLGLAIGFLSIIQIAASFIVIGNALTEKHGSQETIQLAAGLGILNMGAILLALAALVWSKGEKP